MGPAWFSGDYHGLESESWDQYLAGETQVSQRELACPQGPTMGSRHAEEQACGRTALGYCPHSSLCFCPMLQNTSVRVPPPSPRTVQGEKRSHLSPDRTWLVPVSDAGFQLWS